MIHVTVTWESGLVVDFMLVRELMPASVPKFFHDLERRRGHGIIDVSVSSKSERGES